MHPAVKLADFDAKGDARTTQEFFDSFRACQINAWQKYFCGSDSVADAIVTTSITDWKNSQRKISCNLVPDNYRDEFQAK